MPIVSFLPEFAIYKSTLQFSPFSVYPWFDDLDLHIDQLTCFGRIDGVFQPPPPASLFAEDSSQHYIVHTSELHASSKPCSSSQRWLPPKDRRRCCAQFANTSSSAVSVRGNQTGDVQLYKYAWFAHTHMLSINSDSCNFRAAASRTLGGSPHVSAGASVPTNVPHAHLSRLVSSPSSAMTSLREDVWRNSLPPLALIYHVNMVAHSSTWNDAPQRVRCDVKALLERVKRQVHASIDKQEVHLEL